jgi:hypothetical protein
MRLKISKAPHSKVFAIWKSTKGVRDIGDIVFFIFGLEIKIWFSGWA